MRIPLQLILIFLLLKTSVREDIGYFIDAVSTDVFTGGNNYARSFVGFYFDSITLENGLLGVEVESNHLLTELAVGMS